VEKSVLTLQVATEQRLYVFAYLRLRDGRNQITQMLGAAVHGFLAKNLSPPVRKPTQKQGVLPN
jgi:hypothetical protein